VSGACLACPEGPLGSSCSHRRELSSWELPLVGGRPVNDLTHSTACLEVVLLFQIHKVLVFNNLISSTVTQSMLVPNKISNASTATTFASPQVISLSIPLVPLSSVLIYRAI
jgi:hypothetical protein